MQNLGERLRKLRKEKNYTLRELGEKLNMSFSILAMYERGERTPPVDKLLLLADFYGVSTDYLLGRMDNQKDNSHSVQKMIKIPVFYGREKKHDTYIQEKQRNYRLFYKGELEKGEYFYTEVKDNSMQGSRICSGDLVLVKKGNQNLKDGLIILLALKSGNRLIRKIYFKKDNIILQPDNSNYKPLIVNKSEIDVIGKVVRVEFDLK